MTFVSNYAVTNHGSKPFYATEGAAGIDLAATQDYIIYPGRTIIIKTGLRLEIPRGHWGLIKARGSISLKGLVVGAGVVDADYRGEIGVVMHNISDVVVPITEGTRVAQMVIVPYEKLIFKEAALSHTERGEGAYGSTGS